MKIQLLLFLSFLVVFMKPSFAQHNAVIKVILADGLIIKPDAGIVTTGETVQWKNSSQPTYRVTFDPVQASDNMQDQLLQGVQSFGSERISPGYTNSYAFTRQGKYHYFYALHEGSGMTGKNMLEVPSGANQSNHSHQSEKEGSEQHTGENEHQSRAQNQHVNETGHHENNYKSYEKGIGEAAKFKEFPNLHPMIVHFPVVLLMLAAVTQLLAFIKFRKELSWGVLLLLAGGFISGLLAANLWHPHVSADAPEQIRRVFDAHKTYAYTTLWISGIALGIKILSMVIKLKVWIEIVVLLVLLAAAGIVGYTGHLGSQMVYIENVGPQGKHLEEHSH